MDEAGVQVLVTFADESSARRALPNLNEEGIPLALLRVAHLEVALPPHPGRLAYWVAAGGAAAGAVAGGLAFHDAALVAPVLAAGLGVLGSLGGLHADRRRRRRYDETTRASSQRRYEVTCPRSAVTEGW